MTSIKRIPYLWCPICNEAHHASLKSYDCTNHGLWREGVPPIMSWVQCMSCFHVFTDGYFDRDSLRFIMENTHCNQTVQVDEQQRYTSALMVERVTKTIIKDGPIWVDVGFGSGSLMMTASEFGYDVFGLDLREANVDAIQKLGYAALAGTINGHADRTPARGRVSVISMMDVLEHMPFPILAIKAAHDLLKVGGSLIISCPNMGTSVWRDLTSKDMNAYWIEIEHFHNFSRGELVRILEQNGFTPVSYHVSPRYKSGMEIISVKADL